MTAYTAQLTITANTAWDTWYSFSDRACHDTATVYRWYVATFFSAKAKQRYEEIGQIVGCAMVMAVAAGITARIVFQKWVDAEVASCLPADHIADAGKMVEADPFAPTVNKHYPAMAATIADPVAVAVVKVPKAKAKAKPMTETQRLRKECAAAGIRWRNARGEGRHMTNTQMIEALASI